MSTHRTIVVADHHKSVFVCKVLDRGTGEVRSASLPSLRQELERFMRELAGPVLVFVEACRAWEWVSDLCESLGHEFRLVDPRQMPEIARSKKKTDRRDVEAMARRFLIEGDLPRSYCATRVERERRALSRRLSDLRRGRRHLLQKIHAVIDAHGLPAKKEEFGKEEWQAEMRAALSADSWLDLEVLLLQLEQTLALTEIVDRRLKERMADDPAYRRLQRIAGIGPILAAVMVTESVGIQRFKGARQYAAYGGVVPTVRSSAGKARIGRITRSGPRDLRWALCQAVVVAQRAKELTPHKQMYLRKKRKGKPTKVALCAAANKLARVVYAVLAKDQEYDPKLVRA